MTDAQANIYIFFKSESPLSLVLGGILTPGCIFDYTFILILKRRKKSLYLPTGPGHALRLCELSGGKLLLSSPVHTSPSPFITTTVFSRNPSATMEREPIPDCPRTLRFSLASSRELGCLITGRCGRCILGNPVEVEGREGFITAAMLNYQDMVYKTSSNLYQINPFKSSADPVYFSHKKHISRPGGQPSLH